MEKNIHNVMVNASQIKMLFGMDAKRVKELMDGNKQIPLTSVSNKLDKVRSFDERFDGKDKVAVLFDQIQKKVCRTRSRIRCLITNHASRKNAWSARFQCSIKCLPMSNWID